MSTPFKGDLYAALRVRSSADAAQIKAAYRMLVREFHPDANRHRPVEAEARIKEIIEAYAVLGNSQKRAQYDRDARTIRAGASMSAATGALVTRVRVALNLSGEEFAARLGLTLPMFMELEAQDALPASPVQSRTLAALVESAAQALEERGGRDGARDLRLDLERKRARQAVLR